ncbi:hypothetical protein P12x_002922 [Tundrisphaera lichenicola]|uniref:hypothetical protein n=1 Tax=Tundrisphaera lichenicola TaxID=2029860 RepID=UPI003EBD3BA5
MKDECARRGIPLLLFSFVPDPAERESAELARFTESQVKAEGIPYLSIDSYLAENRGRNYYVSFWEKHPDAKCHAIFAGMIADHLGEAVPAHTNILML